MPRKRREYGNNSIQALKGPDRVRLRPGVIFGSDGLDGCCHSVFEILSNSIDEAREGYGNRIEVTYHEDYSVCIKDYGRGIPMDYNETEQKYNYQLVFEELYAGGKYNNNAGEHYEYSLGLNGLGCCATQYASRHMDVESQRDGFRYQMHFEQGYSVGELIKTPVTATETYTKICFLPDLDVFSDIRIPLSYFQETLKRQAVTNKGIQFLLDDKNTGEQYEYRYPSGIEDYVAELAGEDAFTEVHYVETETRGRDRADKPEYKLKAEVAFAFSNEVNRIEYYHNSSFLEYGGSPDKATKSAFVSAIDTYIKSNGKYQRNEKKITFVDIQDSLILLINSFSTMTSYENQTKKAINNKFIQEALTEYLKEQLEIYFIENKESADKIADQILVNKRARETAERARITIKKKLVGAMDPLNRVKKFIDCRSKDIDRRELYIVEGDSALGSTKLGRDADFQGIMAIRGKILNCLKADYRRIFESEIITDLLKVIGTGVEIESKLAKDLPEFSLDRLRWSKIIICTDADVDGFQIRTLILTMFYVLTPTLIEEGRIYIAESPLYEIEHKNKSYFAYNETEKAKLLKRFPSGVKIQRSKGLGENNPDMMWETTMNPDTRRLIQVNMDQAQITEETFDFLLGDNLQGRKDYIEEYGHLYMNQIDES